MNTLDLDKRIQARNMVAKALGMRRNTVTEIALFWDQAQVEGMIRLTNAQEIEAAAIGMVPVEMLPQSLREAVTRSGGQPEVNMDAPVQTEVAVIEDCGENSAADGMDT
jgi:hypothetical protein